MGDAIEGGGMAQEDIFGRAERGRRPQCSAEEEVPGNHTVGTVAELSEGNAEISWGGGEACWGELCED